MRVGARPFGNARDAVPYCQQLGVNTAIMECTQIPGWEGRGYLEPDGISEALEILDRGGISCSVLVGQTVPVAGRSPQDNPELQNTIATVRAMGEAGVATLLLFQLEEIADDADREALWPFFAANHRPLVEAAAEAGVHIAMHGYFPPMGLVDGNTFFARSFAEMPDIHNGICYDPGIMAICGDDPLAGLDAFQERIHMVHIRDVNGDWKSVEDMRQDAYDLEVFPGTGIAQNEQAVRRLHEIGYQGVVQPEHLGLPGEAELLPAAMRYLRSLIGSLA